VTEARAAICLAQEGGLGIIHKTSPRPSGRGSAARQEVRERRDQRAVHRHPDTTISRSPQAHAREAHLRRAGHERRPAGRIVTGRDMRFETRFDEPVARSMTPKERLVTVKEGATRDEIRSCCTSTVSRRCWWWMKSSASRACVTVKDIQKSSEFPNSAKDSSAGCWSVRPLVLAKVPRSAVEKLVAAGVGRDRGGHGTTVIRRRVRSNRLGKKAFPEGAGHRRQHRHRQRRQGAARRRRRCRQGRHRPGLDLYHAHGGGVGVPQITAIANVAEALHDSDVTLIAMRHPLLWDVVKAIAAGAHCIMIGSLLAGTDESPGQIEIFQGRSYKSIAAWARSVPWVRARVTATFRKVRVPRSLCRKV